MRKGGDPDPVTKVVSRRLIAWIIDCLVITAIVFALIAGVDAALRPAIVLRTDAPALHDMLHYDTWILVLDAVLATTVSAVYGIVPWSTVGATPGQLILGLRVVNQADRSFPTVFKSFQRWLLVFPPVGTVAAFLADAPAPLAALVWAAAFTWFVVLLMTTALSETSQGLHDRLLGEVVQKS
jgi:uncharacterized RDD family membrane protein YckC